MDVRAFVYVCVCVCEGHNFEGGTYMRVCRLCIISLKLNKLNTVHTTRVILAPNMLVIDLASKIDLYRTKEQRI